MANFTYDLAFQTVLPFQAPNSPSVIAFERIHCWESA